MTTWVRSTTPKRVLVIVVIVVALVAFLAFSGSLDYLLSLLPG